jgi:hypothetical protein
MTAILQIVMTVATLLPAEGATTSWPQSRPSSESYRDRYGVVSERSIFLKERGRPASSRSEHRDHRDSSPRRAEDSFILTGIVFEDGEFRAYLENTDNSSVFKLRVGEPVARGVVTQIQIDGLEYQSGSQRTWIEIGRRLTGAQMSSVIVASSSSQPSSTPLPNPNDPNLTLEQRMRLRRMQELNKK